MTDVYALTAEAREHARRGRARLSVGTPEKYPLAGVTVPILWLEAVAAALESAQERERELEARLRRAEGGMDASRGCDHPALMDCPSCAPWKFPRTADQDAVIRERTLVDAARFHKTRAERAEEALAAADQALREIEPKQQEALRIIAQNGFVFEDIGHEPGNWQHLAFTLYSELCEIDSIARAALVGLDAPPPAVQNQEGQCSS